MDSLSRLVANLKKPRVSEVTVTLGVSEGEEPRSDKGTISTFLQSRIHESFTRYL